MPHTNMAEADLAALIVVDVQLKMLAAAGSSPPEAIIDRIRRMVGAADVLGIPVIYTEQYPQGIGPTDPQVRQFLSSATGPIVKTTLSCWRDPGFRSALEETGREHVVLVGLETHACIQQTALDLVRVDYQVFVAADAVGSRFGTDTEVALERMRHAGVEVSTAESLILEWVERCDHPRFKEIIELVR